MADVRFGSKADICNANRHVRFTPESGHSWLRLKCPLCANSGLWAYRIARMPVNYLGDMSEGLPMDKITEPAKLKAATTYNAAADHFDDGPLAFWDRYGNNRTASTQAGIDRP